MQRNLTNEELENFKQQADHGITQLQTNPKQSKEIKEKLLPILMDLSDHYHSNTSNSFNINKSIQAIYFEDLLIELGDKHDRIKLDDRLHRSAVQSLRLAEFYCVDKRLHLANKYFLDALTTIYKAIQLNFSSKHHKKMFDAICYQYTELFAYTLTNPQHGMTSEEISTLKKNILFLFELQKNITTYRKKHQIIDSIRSGIELSTIDRRLEHSIKILNQIYLTLKQNPKTKIRTELMQVGLLIKTCVQTQPTHAIDIKHLLDLNHVLLLLLRGFPKLSQIIINSKLVHHFIKVCIDERQYARALSMAQASFETLRVGETRELFIATLIKYAAYLPERKYNEAQECYEKALVSISGFNSDDLDRKDFLYYQAKCHHGLSQCLFNNFKQAECKDEHLLEKALEHITSALRSDPDNQEYHQQLAVLQLNLGKELEVRLKKCFLSREEVEVTHEKAFQAFSSIVNATIKTTDNGVMNEAKLGLARYLINTNPVETKKLIGEVIAYIDTISPTNNEHLRLPYEKISPENPEQLMDLIELVQKKLQSCLTVPTSSKRKFLSGEDQPHNRNNIKQEPKRQAISFSH